VPGGDGPAFPAPVERFRQYPATTPTTSQSQYPGTTKWPTTSPAAAPAASFHHMAIPPVLSEPLGCTLVFGYEERAENMPPVRAIARGPQAD